MEAGGVDPPSEDALERTCYTLSLVVLLDPHDWARAPVVAAIPQLVAPSGADTLPIAEPEYISHREDYGRHLKARRGLLGREGVTVVGSYQLSRLLTGSGPRACIPPLFVPVEAVSPPCCERAHRSQRV